MADDQLDFETIIPMPPELRDTQAGSSDPYVWALGGELYASRNSLRRIGLRLSDATPLDWPWVRDLGITSREGLLHWAKENRPNELTVAKRAMDNEHATGYRDWYDWRLRQLGMQVGLLRVCVAERRPDCILYDDPLVGA